MVQTAVIVAQHGGSALTLRSVMSFQRHHPHDLAEIIVVDDGSPRRERQWLQRRLPSEVMLVPLLERRGVTAAWSRGAEASRGEILVFLNNDTTSIGCWLPRLVSPLIRNSSPGATSLRAPLLTGVAWRPERDIPESIRRWCPERQVLAGWCLALKRQTYDHLGRLDERLQLYYSDTDLQCRAIQAAGSASALDVVRELPLRHVGAASTRHLPGRNALWRADRRYFLKKWSAIENAHARTITGESKVDER